MVNLMGGWQAEVAKKAWKHVDLSGGILPSKERSTLFSSITLQKSILFLFVINYLHFAK